MFYTIAAKLTLEKLNNSSISITLIKKMGLPGFMDDEHRLGSDFNFGGNNGMVEHWNDGRHFPFFKKSY
jgi:hypothetical protein